MGGKRGGEYGEKELGLEGRVSNILRKKGGTCSMGGKINDNEFHRVQ